MLAEFNIDPKHDDLIIILICVIFLVILAANT
jgi:hypothetical protein